MIYIVIFYSDSAPQKRQIRTCAAFQVRIEVHSLTFVYINSLIIGGPQGASYFHKPTKRIEK
jgi:hypothetical protein